MATQAREILTERTPLAARSRRVRGKREAIIAAAKDTFLKEGYAGASMDRITAVAGVSKATVYNHFRSKEELLLAVVEDVIVPFQEEYRAILDHEAPFLEWLTELAISISRKAANPETVALTRLMIGESLRFPDLGRMFLATAIEASFDMYVPKFAEAMARGILRQGDVRQMVQHFVEACSSGPQRNLMFCAPEPITPEQVDNHARNAVAFFLDGCGARD
jgi:TetR/AcrR family transcriptional regulator, mexJK operon transcriptional repressor